MDKLLTLFVILSIGFASCEKEHVDIEYVNVQNNQMLSEFKADMVSNGICSCRPYIGEYRWKGKTFYRFGTRGAACDAVPFVWDRLGMPIKVPTTFSGEAEFVKYNYELTCETANKQQ